MLAQLATVKSRIGITDSTDDTLLTGLIDQAGALFDQFCNRTFARAVDAVDEFRAGETDIALRHLPIETVKSFEIKSTETDGWEVPSLAVDYIIRNSCVISLAAALGTWRDQARVTYTGGYVLPGTTPGAGQLALPKDIENACVEQVGYWYRARNRGGISSASGGGSSITQDAGLTLLPIVASTLQSYRRLQL